jgi:glucose-6-phosphate 1-dehydrogenase
MTRPATMEADVLVIFGITGDLAKKQTFRALYRMERRAELRCPIVGVARGEWSAATLRDHARRAIQDSGEKISERVFRRLAERLSMISGDYQDPKTFDRIAQAVEGRDLPVYLEIPPALFARVVAGLARAGLTKEARVAIEKPFGHDLASARALNAELHRFLKERQIYRIDHFLGKEPTMDILYLRFANSIFEPLWNRDLRGDARLFVREDSEEQTWRIVQPLLDAPPPVQPYARGSWGPAGADNLLTGHPSWRRAWLPPRTAR